MKRSKPTRTNDPAMMRARILDAAVRLFHRKGYGETSMQDIMRAASVTSGALHHHYTTKKGLGLAVIRERVAPMVDDAWVSPVRDAPDPERGVADAFNGVIDGLKAGSIAGCPLNNLAVELAFAEPDFRKEIQPIFDNWHQVLARRIEEGGRVPGVSADDLATLIIASYSGAMTLAKSAQSPEPLNRTLKSLAKLWSEGALAA